jgi:hypothetical protein
MSAVTPASAAAHEELNAHSEFITRHEPSYEMPRHTPYDDEDDDSSVSEPDGGDEAGVMDYRGSTEVSRLKSKNYRVSIEFSFSQTSEHYSEHPFDEAKWCAKFNPVEIAADFDWVGEIIRANWVAGTTELVIDIKPYPEFASKKKLTEYFEENCLEDGQFEACPGDGFWVVSFDDIAEQAASA